MNTKITETTTTATDVKKDHAIGAGSGALAGAITGGTAGTVLGPVGTVIGAVGGALLGAKVGDEVAEMVNPTEIAHHFEKTYQSRPYYNQDRTWQDYAPAYQYGSRASAQYPDQRFDDIEDRLRHDWEETKLDTRLAWMEARDAVRDGWEYVKDRADRLDGKVDRRPYE